MRTTQSFSYRHCQKMIIQLKSSNPLLLKSIIAMKSAALNWLISNCNNFLSHRSIVKILVKVVCLTTSSPSKNRSKHRRAYHNNKYLKKAINHRKESEAAAAAKTKEDLGWQWRLTKRTKLLKSRLFNNSLKKRVNQIYSKMMIQVPILVI